jgi:two-component system sensor histidine kinase RegB
MSGAPSVTPAPHPDDAGLANLDATAGRKNMHQLIQLRWIAVAGQVLTIAVTLTVFHIALPVAAMTGVLALLALLNIAGQGRLTSRAPVGNNELLLALLLDVLALTAQLYFSGGASNPFISLYLLQVTLAAMLLEAWSTWAVVVVAGLAFAALTVAYRPLVLPPSLHADLFTLHIQGMLVCFVLDAGLVVVFMNRISRNLRTRDARLAHLRQQAAEEGHIVRMGLLASGAAHELGTPLATMAVILNDWRRIPALVKDADLRQELEDMESEVRRCKAIVTGILMSAGEARGEGTAVQSARVFFDEIVEEWRSKRTVGALAYRNGLPGDLAIVADSALKQVIGNVLDNAAEASPQWVGLSASVEGDWLKLAVVDRGPGFTPEGLENLGKPYQSTKGRRGGGLGLFLVFNVLRKLGGQLAARNLDGGGASVTLTLPLDALTLGKASDAD